MKPVIWKTVILLALSCIPGTAITQWMSVPIPTNASFTCIKFTDSLNGFMSGDAILKTSDGGNNWSVVLSGFYTGLIDMSFPSQSTGYAVGDYGTVMKTIDGGNNWFSLNTGLWDVLRGVYFLNPDTGFICGAGEVIYRTTDGGLTWELQNFGSYWLRCFSFPSPQIGYCVGDGKTIYKTINGGQTWNFMSGWGSTDTNITDVTFLTSDIGYVCGKNGYIAKTTDGGYNWQILNSGTTKFFEGIWFSNLSEGYVVGESGTILKTIDSGLTWIQEVSSSDTTLRKIFFPTSEKGFICGFAGTLLTNFCTPLAGFSFNAYYLSVYFQNESSVCTQKYWWSFGDGYYSDLENPWHMYTLPGLYEVCLEATDTVSGKSDTTCQWLDIPTVGFSEKNKMVTLYPNPCQGRFIIQNPGRVPFQQVEIFEQSGRKVFSCPLFRTQDERITIPVDLPDGLYLVRGYDEQGPVLMKKIAVVR